MSDQEKDPVVHSSLSKHLFIWSALLVLSLAWGLWDEITASGRGRVPGAVREALLEVPEDCNRRRGDVEKQIKASPEYQQLDAEMQAAEKAAMPAASAIDKKVNQDWCPKSWR